MGYVFVAHRIDPDDSQNLGDFAISRRVPESEAQRYGATHHHYHYNSRSGRIINRATWAMPVINNGSRIYRECLKAVERLIEEEKEVAWSKKQ